MNLLASSGHFFWYHFIEPLSIVSIQKALIGGSLAAVACGAIGCFIILRRMAFLGDALSHSMLAGVTAGYLLMQTIFGTEADAGAMIIGSLIAGIITILSIGAISRASRIKEDTAIGIMYTGIFALGGLLASYFSDRIHIHLYDYIMGMVLAVRDTQLWVMAFVTAGVLTTVILFFRPLQIATFDPVMAASIGVPVVAMHYLLTGCASLVVVSAVSVVGVILVVGLLVTPAATAYLLSERLSRMIALAGLFGVTSVVMGLYMSIWVDRFAPGASIVVASTVQFLVVWVVAPRHGLLADWLTRRWRVPERLLEDILGTLRRNEGKPATIALIQQHIREPATALRRALRQLDRRQWIVPSAQGYLLTPDGQREARRLMRAHRLWEAYLKHMGTPDAQLHQQAHRLEHVHDEAAVDYLDDKLGHPLVDPHGAEIPEDFVHLGPDALVKASLLREGHLGVVTEVAPPAQRTNLQAGMQITVGPRRDEGRLWVFRLPDGTEAVLDHEAADAVTVKFIESPPEASRAR